jgi:hypothetical protein
LSPLRSHYTRVSTLHQVGGRFDACESQAAICRDTIKKRAHEGWTQFSCHTDAVYSGDSMNRTGLQALMRQIEAGEVKVVLIFKFEQLLRNTDGWAPFRSFLARPSCRLVSTSEDLSGQATSGRLRNCWADFGLRKRGCRAVYERRDELFTYAPTGLDMDGRRGRDDYFGVEPRGDSTRIHALDSPF